jgi:hypothetical protein
VIKDGLGVRKLGKGEYLKCIIQPVESNALFDGAIFEESKQENIAAIFQCKYSLPGASMSLDKREILNNYDLLNANTVLPTLINNATVFYIVCAQRYVATDKDTKEEFDANPNLIVLKPAQLEKMYTPSLYSRPLFLSQYSRGLSTFVCGITLPDCVICNKYDMDKIGICTTCKKAYHAKCLKKEKFPKVWHCSHCTKKVTFCSTTIYIQAQEKKRKQSEQIKASNKDEEDAPEQSQEASTKRSLKKFTTKGTVKRNLKEEEEVKEEEEKGSKKKGEKKAGSKKDLKGEVEDELKKGDSKKRKNQEEEQEEEEKPKKKSSSSKVAGNIHDSILTMFCRVLR